VPLDARLRWVVAGSFVSVAARMSTVTFLSIYFTYVAGIDVALVGVAFLVENVVRGVVALPMGALSDRVGRRPVIVASLAVSAAILPLFLLVRTPSGLLLWSVAMGLGGSGVNAAVSALILDLVPVRERQRALAINYTAISVGYTLGVAPAGFLADAGYGWLAAASCAGYLVVLLVYLVALRGPLPREGGARPTSVLRGALRAPSDPAFVALVATCFVFPLGIGLTANASSLYGADAGLSKDVIGLLLSTNGVVLAFLAIPVATRLEPAGPFRMLGLSAAFLAAAFVALALAPPAAGLLLGTTVFTFGELIFSSAVPTAVAMLAPPGARGAYQGAWGMVFSVSVGGALFLAGLLKERIGWPRAWLAFAALAALEGALLLATRARFRAIASARADLSA